MLETGHQSDYDYVPGQNAWFIHFFTLFISGTLPVIDDLVSNLTAVHMIAINAVPQRN